MCKISLALKYWAFVIDGKDRWNICLQIRYTWRLTVTNEYSFSLMWHWVRCNIVRHNWEIRWWIFFFSQKGKLTNHFIFYTTWVEVFAAKILMLNRRFSPMPWRCNNKSQTIPMQYARFDAFLSRWELCACSGNECQQSPELMQHRFRC